MRQYDNKPTAESGAEVIERGIMCVEDVVSSPVPLNAEVADIFLTTRGVYYVPYGRFLHTGSFGAFASGLVGGLTMGFATIGTDNARLDAAFKHAKEKRAADYGLACAERQLKYKGVFVPRGELTRLEFDPSKRRILIAHTGGEIECYSPISGELEAPFFAYVSGKLTPLGIDGVDVRLPTATEIIAACKSEAFHPRVAGRILPTLARNHRALVDLILEFTKETEPNMRVVAGRLAIAPAGFTQALANALATEIETSQRSKQRSAFQMRAFFMLPCYGLGFVMVCIGIVGSGNKGGALFGGLIIVGLGIAAHYLANADLAESRRLKVGSELLLSALQQNVPQAGATSPALATDTPSVESPVDVQIDSIPTLDDEVLSPTDFGQELIAKSANPNLTTFLVRTFKHWHSGELSKISPDYAGETGRLGLKGWIDSALKNCQAALDAVTSLGGIQDGDWLVGINSDHFVLTTKRLYFTARGWTPTSKVKVVNIQEIEEYRVEGIWLGKVTIRLKSGEVIKARLLVAPRPESIELARNLARTAVT